MQVVRNIVDIKSEKNSVLTVGTFDGVHLGHAEIFRRLKSIADENDYTSLVVTFDPHPRTVVSEDYKLSLLNTFNEKVKLLTEFGIDYLVVVNFTKLFAEQSSEEFIKNVLVDKLALKHFVIGHDHKFGKDRLGNEAKLREYGEKYKVMRGGSNFNNHSFIRTTQRYYLLPEKISRYFVGFRCVNDIEQSD